MDKFYSQGDGYFFRVKSRNDKTGRCDCIAVGSETVHVSPMVLDVARVDALQEVTMEVYDRAVEHVVAQIREIA